MATRIDKLTDAQSARMEEWADRWIEVGLRTAPADREKFEKAVRECYRFAGLEEPRVVVWAPSPLVVSLAGPIASSLLSRTPPSQGGVRERVLYRGDGAVRGAVDGAVRGAVDGAVGGAVDGAVDGAVGGAVGGAVDGAVDGAVRGAVGGAVDGAVGGAVEAIRRSWNQVFGGQFWVGGSWRWGGAYTSFFREVCDLELQGDLWARARAYEDTMESACWWWPHRQFVIVSERPTEIHRELVDPTRPRGWGSHRLHRDDGPAIVWPDGWGVWSWHGTRVPQRVIERPETLTAHEVNTEENAEVRRAMLERMGMERFVREAGAIIVNTDEWGTLYSIPPANDDEPLMVVKVTNSTPEPDGTFKDYLIPVDPNAYGGLLTARAAIASTWRIKRDGERPENWELAFKTPEEYQPAVQT